MPDRPLSMCMVTTFYPPYHFGGDAMYIYRLSNELGRRGHDVTVIHCLDAHELIAVRTPSSHGFPNHPNVKVHRLRSAWGSVSPLWTYLVGQPGLKAAALHDIFQRQQFDVTHFHNVSLIGGPGVLRYGNRVKLYTMHEHWLICPMHVLWKNNHELCEQPECLRCTLTFRRPPQLWRYTDLLSRELGQVHQYLSPSQFTKGQHEERGFAYPIRHLPNFLPIWETQVGASEAWPAQPRPYFLFVGRLEKMKGLQTLIEVFRLYTSADLLVAGGGGYEHQLRGQAAGLSNVRFLGNVEPAALHGLYRGALALIVPSLCYETFGMVTLEAFAQRTPAIVRDLGGLPETVSQSGGGFTYRTDRELVRAMESLQSDSALRAQLGERGYQGFVRYWSDEPHLRAYLETIDEISERQGFTQVHTA